MELMQKFPDDKTAEAWFVQSRWPEGIVCPHCGSVNVNPNTKHRSMPYRCRDCRKRFSTRTATVMECSKLGFQIWAIAIFLIATNLKGISSMKLQGTSKNWAKPSSELPSHHEKVSPGAGFVWTSQLCQGGGRQFFEVPSIETLASHRKAHGFLPIESGRLLILRGCLDLMGQSKLTRLSLVANARICPMRNARS